MAWEYVPIVLSLYNAFIITYEIGFGLSYNFLQVYLYLEYSINLILLFDFLLMFFTSFQNRYGCEIKEPYKIFQAHIRTSRFMLDVLTTISFLKPLHLVFSFFQLFKVTRIFMIN